MGSFKLGKMTLRSVFHKAETVCYPAQQKVIPPAMRGPVENDMDVCILCGMCVRCCPANAIEVDKKAGTWSINHFRCVQCGACTRNCPKDCLSLAQARVSIATSIEPEVLHKPVAEAAEGADQ